MSPKTPKQPSKGKPLMGEFEVIPVESGENIGDAMARVMKDMKPKKKKTKLTEEEKQERKGKTVRASDGKLVDRPKRGALKNDSQTGPEPHEKPEEKKTGRPTVFTPELADAICAALIEGESLRTICDAEDMPHIATVMRWIAKGSIARTAGEKENEYAIFCEQYAHAREVQADVLVDETLSIADDGRNDWMEKFGRDGESIGWMVNGEAMQRSKLRVETRKWVAEKMNPKKYAPMQKHADADGEKLPPPVTNDLELARKMAFVLAKAKKG